MPCKALYDLAPSQLSNFIFSHSLLPDCSSHDGLLALSPTGQAHYTLERM